MSSVADALPALTLLNVLSISLLTICSFFTAVYVYTSIRFQLDYKRFVNLDNGKQLKPPHLPYTIPWIGNAPSFLVKKPHKFWAEVFSWYPRSAGSFWITLGGNPTAVIFNAPGVHYILKDRKLDRQKFNVQVTVNGLGMTPEDAEKYYEHHAVMRPGQIPAHAAEERRNVEYLMKPERTNELTGDFMQELQRQTSTAFEDGPEEIGLYKWLRTTMFRASTIALMGTKVFEVAPNLETLFFQFDQDMLSMFFGLPKLLIRKEYSNRDKTIDALTDWQERVREISGGVIPDPEEIQWEPLYGSRYNRARHLNYRARGLNPRSAAGLDMGMLFGLSSNAIPATGWMLMHILHSTTKAGAKDGTTLYEEIMAELKEVQKADGGIDISTLVNQPILLSTLHEVLRVYVDVLVSRQIDHDMALPFSQPDSSNDKTGVRSLMLKAGDMVMMPSYPSHTNPEWQAGNQPPPNEFYPYRFLSSSPTACKGDKPVFSTALYNGMFFPFGGGKTICPGRSFARQEILGAVATILLTFDLELLGYTDGKGQPTSSFPTFRDSFPGSGVCAASGDTKVRITRR